MAAAKKCDRCGKLYNPYNIKNDAKNINGIMTVNIDLYGKYYSNKPKDPCLECKDSFEEWLFAGKPVGEVKKENKNE